MACNVSTPPSTHGILHIRIQGAHWSNGLPLGSLPVDMWQLAEAAGGRVAVAEAVQRRHCFPHKRHQDGRVAVPVPVAVAQCFLQEGRQEGRVYSGARASEDTADRCRNLLCMLGTAILCLFCPTLSIPAISSIKADCQCRS